MIKHGHFLLLLTLILTFITGCDQACDVSVTSVAKIDNLTNTELNIKVCNLATSSMQSIELTANQAGPFTLETHIEKKIYTGGPPTACDATHRATGIYLSAENFDQYKFCHDPDTSAKIAIIESNQACPEGLIAQLATIDTCK